MDKSYDCSYLKKKKMNLINPKKYLSNYDLVIVQVFYNPFGNPDNPFGSAESVYDFISCWRAPGGDLGNLRQSYLTFFSPGTS